MDAIELSTGIYAAAAALAECLPLEELNRAALVFTQLGTTLGTTLGTIAALKSLDGGGDGQEVLTGRF